MPQRVYNCNSIFRNLQRLHVLIWRFHCYRYFSSWRCRLFFITTRHIATSDRQHRRSIKICVKFQKPITFCIKNQRTFAGIENFCVGQQESFFSLTNLPAIYEHCVLGVPRCSIRTVKEQIGCWNTDKRPLEFNWEMAWKKILNCATLYFPLANLLKS